MSPKSIPTIADRIKQQVRDIPKDMVSELTLDNSDGKNFDGLTDEFKKLEVLSLINCQITSLENFPTLPNLRIIDLSSNNISTGIEHLNKCSEIGIINLADNPISDFDQLKPLGELKKLTKLIVADCEITSNPDYSKKIFDMFPNLTFIDHLDRDGNPDPLVLEMAGQEDDGECEEISLDEFLAQSGDNDEKDECSRDEKEGKCCGDEDKACGTKRKNDNNKDEDVKKRRSD